MQRWRLVLGRGALAAGEDQREQQAAWDSALAASGLPIAGLDADRAKPRSAFAAPLGASISGEAELADVWLVERLPRWRVWEALAAHLPTAFTLVDLYDVWLGEAALPGRVVASVYRATVGAGVDAARLASAAGTLLAASSLPRDRRKGAGTIAYDLRPFLEAIEVAGGPGGTAVVRMTLRHDPSRGIGRPDETLAALGEAADGEPLTPASLVRERLVLGDTATRDTPAPAGARRPSAARGGRR